MDDGALFASGCPYAGCGRQWYLGVCVCVLLLCSEYGGEFASGSQMQARSCYDSGCGCEEGAGQRTSSLWASERRLHTNFEDRRRGKVCLMTQSSKNLSPFFRCVECCVAYGSAFDRRSRSLLTRTGNGQRGLLFGMVGSEVGFSSVCTLRIRCVGDEEMVRQ